MLESATWMPLRVVWAAECRARAARAARTTRSPPAAAVADALGAASVLASVDGDRHVALAEESFHFGDADVGSVARHLRLTGEPHRARAAVLALEE